MHTHPIVEKVRKTAKIAANEPSAATVFVQSENCICTEVPECVGDVVTLTVDT